MEGRGLDSRSEVVATAKMLPWTFEPSVYVAPSFPGWKSEQEFAAEDGSALVAGMCDPR